MKKIYYLIIPLFFLACNEDDVIQINEVQNNQQIIYTEDDVPILTEQLLNKYSTDAAYIDFSEIVKDSILKENQIYLNQDKVEQYYSDLILIHKKSYLLGNPFFENFLNVYNFQAPIMYMMFAVVDSSKGWIQNIVNGSNYTGVESIDSLTTNYELVIRYASKFNENYMINISSSTPYNTFALSKIFLATQEFNYFDPNAMAGDASSIEFKKENNLRVYIYRLGWEDCEVGCMFNHYWEIGVAVNNRVGLLNEYGDSLSKK